MVLGTHLLVVPMLDVNERPILAAVLLQGPV
jgi:hypothetical protein